MSQTRGTQMTAALQRSLRCTIPALSPIMLAMPGRLAGQATPVSAALGSRGMVSSAHAAATDAGLDVLRRGGNAFDAAVAIAAALNVVEPMNSGMGGYGTILVYNAAKHQVLFLNSSTRIPRAVNADAYRSPTPGYLENRRGAKAISTPGNVPAWEAMSLRFGRLPWKTLFGPAIRLADSGFTLTALDARTLATAFPEFSSYSKNIYGVNGAPLAAGQRLVQHDLARSLRLVAQDAR